MAYVQSKVMKKRLQDRRRVSGAALLREELNVNAGNSSLMADGTPNAAATASLLHDAYTSNLAEDRGVMLANFEEWIKMATDNKINTTNSWNFALIDYFHDMKVLREKDNNINFQKASATLDGCVKIYSSRVDSVATETGRLLSGLATRKESPDPTGEEQDEDGLSDDDGDEEGGPYDQKLTSGKKSKRVKLKTQGSTLATFESIRIKKLSQELSIDPLFKKTLAEFDEGGAKSLLLNTLHMDNRSRVVFDASTTNGNDVDDESPKDVDEDDGEDVEMSGMEDDEEEEEEEEDEEGDVDISALKEMLFKGLEDDMGGLTLCPSMIHLGSVLQDINKAKSILNGFVDDSIAKAGPSTTLNDVIGFEGFDDFGDEGGPVDFDFGGNDNSFGELEEEAAAVIFEDGLPDDQEITADNTGIVASIVDHDLMAYFDNTLKRNWAGPEHWKVKQFKKEKATELKANVPKTGKPKEVFMIDFSQLLNDEEVEAMFAPAKMGSLMPQSEWESSDHHLLPNDISFTSDNLTRLFLKPQKRVAIFRKTVTTRPKPDLSALDTKQAEATIWAENYKDAEQERSSLLDAEDGNPFYNDNGMDFDFDDVGSNSQLEDGKANFGTQLITGGAKVKPEYVTYSKKAKNVNVKKLKDNMWKSIEVQKTTEKEETQFSEIVQDISKMYPREQKKELSTSFCFICLLHLANEHGLTIDNDDQLVDLKVTGFKDSLNDA